MKALSWVFLVESVHSNKEGSVNVVSDDHVVRRYWQILSFQIFPLKVSWKERNRSGMVESSEKNKARLNRSILWLIRSFDEESDLNNFLNNL